MDKSEDRNVQGLSLSHQRGFWLAHYPEQSGKGNFANYPEPGVDIITKYQHLKSVEIHDTNIKPELPIRLILWAGEYAKIKTNLTPRVGSQENQ